jgi:hypothetical protein
MDTDTEKTHTIMISYVWKFVDLGLIGNLENEFG